MRLVLVLALVVAPVAGCKRGTPEKVPTCAELTDHLSAVTKIAYPGHGDMEMGNRPADIAKCEERNPSPDERRCIMAAKDLNAIASCRKAALKK